MRKQKSPFALLLLAIGLLFVSLTYFVGRKYQLPDFDRGIFMGAGVGLELVAVWLMVRQKRSAFK
jgi:hypothetical protein